MLNHIPDEAAIPFDLEKANKVISGAIVGMLTLGLTNQEEVDSEMVNKVWGNMREALLGGAHACAEIRRMRQEITELRDSHRPRPHADQSQPGALCTACSLEGALISWPCQVWTASDRILTQGQP